MRAPHQAMTRRLARWRLVLRHTNFEATMARIVAMLCRRARRVPNPAARDFAPGTDFAMVAINYAICGSHRFETCVSEH